jgi:hypothetical protein
LWASENGKLLTIQWLLTVGGACIKDVDRDGNSAVLLAAGSGNLPTVHYLLAEGGANIADVDANGATVWSQLGYNIHRSTEEELSELLKVMVLLGDAPADFSAQRSRQHGEIIAQGQQLRAQLPGYVREQHALLTLHCPLIAGSYTRTYTLQIHTYTHTHTHTHIHTHTIHHTTLTYTHKHADLQALLSAYAAPTLEDMWND